MRLAKIEHYRCHESTYKYTLVFVADDMTPEDLRKLINEAIVATISAEKEFEGVAEPRHYSKWDFQSRADKNKTLAEVDAEYEQHESVWKAWCTKRDAARMNFKARLKSLAPDRIQTFYEHGADIEVDAEWGHNHGVKVEYGEDEGF